MLGVRARTHLLRVAILALCRDHGHDHRHQHAAGEDSCKLHDTRHARGAQQHVSGVRDRA